MNKIYYMKKFNKNNREPPKFFPLATTPLSSRTHKRKSRPWTSHSFNYSTASFGSVSENEPLFCSWNFFLSFWFFLCVYFFSIPWMTHWEPKGSQSKQTRQGSHPEGLSCSTFDLFCLGDQRRMKKLEESDFGQF